MNSTYIRLFFALLTVLTASCRSTPSNRFSSLSSARQYDIALRMAKTYTTPCFESDGNLYGLELDSDEYKEYKQEMEKSGRIIQRRMTEATKKPVLEIRRLEHQVLQEMLPEYSLYHVLYISSDPRKHGPNIYRQWAVMAIRNDMTPVFLTSNEDIMHFISRTTEEFGDHGSHAIFAHKAIQAFALLRGLRPFRAHPFPYGIGDVSKEELNRETFLSRLTQEGIYFHYKNDERAYLVDAMLFGGGANDMPGVVSMRVVIEVSQQGELKLIGFFHYGGEV